MWTQVITPPLQGLHWLEICPDIDQPVTPDLAADCSEKCGAGVGHDTEGEYSIVVLAQAVSGDSDDRGAAS